MTREEKLKELGFKTEFYFNDLVCEKEDENYVYFMTFYAKNHKFDNNFAVFLLKIKKPKTQ